MQVPLRQPRRLAISGCAADISATQNAIQPSRRPGMKPRAKTVMVFVHALDGHGIHRGLPTYSISLLRRNAGIRRSAMLVR